MHLIEVVIKNHQLRHKNMIMLRAITLSYHDGSKVKMFLKRYQNKDNAITCAYVVFIINLSSPRPTMSKGRVIALVGF